MLRSILVGLDGSPTTSVAVDFGIRWARRFNAILVGLGVVDRPGICRTEPTGIGGSHYKKHSSERLLADAHEDVKALLGTFARRCAAAAVSHQTLENEGHPDEEIVKESERFDITVLGQTARFRFHAQNGDRRTLRNVLRKSAHPVVVVPPKPADGNAIVVACDGSAPASRALHDFVASGLADGSEVHVVNVCVDRRRGEGARDYLLLHRVAATEHVLNTGTRPAKALLDKAVELQAGLIVAGAFGRNRLRAFLFGSTTAALLQDSPIPLFLSH
jgi:nucleotide-binding universal stress UspA family protein